MDITPDTPIAELVRAVPASIAVLQKYGVPFCCTGPTSLATACKHHDLDPAGLVAEIEAVRSPRAGALAANAPLRVVMDHLRTGFHQPLRDELPRISGLLSKVVTRHGERLAAVLPPLQDTFEEFRARLTDHIAREDRALFPAIERIEAGTPGAADAGHPLRALVQAFQREHRESEDALARMRELTGSYTPPGDACPTFRGLYYALAELERSMQEHVHIENDVLFPRALAVAAGREA